MNISSLHDQKADFVLMRKLGDKIRVERKALGLSISEFARLVGTSKTTLQRIETGAKSPSIALLQDISHVCRKPIDAFILEAPREFVRIDEGEQRKILTKNAEIRIICPYGLLSRDIVVNYFKANPGTRMEPHQDEGYEWIYVIKGSCIVEYDNKEYSFKEGDALFWDARKTHSYKVLTPFESIRISVRI
jgi:transcriptional regulator with XRE-family HTH domain